MKAAVLNLAQNPPGHLLRIGDVPQPSARTGQVLLRVLACGVCRTDLHIAEGELPPLHEDLIPGHQIVGEIVEGATPELPACEAPLVAALEKAKAMRAAGKVDDNFALENEASDAYVRCWSMRMNCLPDGLRRRWKSAVYDGCRA